MCRGNLNYLPTHTSRFKTKFDKYQDLDTRFCVIENTTSPPLYDVSHKSIRAKFLVRQHIDFRVLESGCQLNDVGVNTVVPSMFGADRTGVC